jgi:4-diphosphocytidyl-2-C-methyl-D-erythritol kinase
MLLIPAHAKLNLCLAVRGRRPDGFHDIDSVVTAIDWHDLLGIRVRPAEVTTVRLRLAGETVEVPPADENLAWRAARAVAAIAGPLDVELWLDKRIPVEAGLGGGSTDAAAVLRGCTDLLDAGSVVDQRRLTDIAASLGSDVPMLLRARTQRARGRGEDLTPIAAPPLHMAVAVVGTSSTAATYAAVEDFDFEDGTRSDAVAAALEAGRRPDDDLLGSGLERPACHVNPTLDERLLVLRAGVAEARWHLTGSGGAAFALAGDAAQAAELAAAAREVGVPARACRSVSG